MALFLLKTGTLNLISCFVEIFFRKEKGKYTVTLINGSSLILPRIYHGELFGWRWGKREKEKRKKTEPIPNLK